MKKSIIISLAILVLLSGSVLAQDIGYVLKNSNNPNQEFISAINELGYSYNLIDDSDISSTDFLEYGMILIDEGNFGSYVEDIPVNEMNSLIANTYHMYDWHWIVGGVSQVASSHPLEAQVVDETSRITQEIDSPFQVYTQAKDQGIAIPMYYLSKEKTSLYIRKIVSIESDHLDPSIATTEPGTRLKDNYIANANGVFFGITKTEFWTQDSKNLFKNSIIWLMEGQDRDGDGFFTGEDCNDDDPEINPDAEEIPYDGIDQNCDGEDLRDVDEDNYDAEIVGGDDCDDNDSTVNPGSSNPLKDCVNQAPEFLGGVETLSWDEDETFSFNLDNYFSDPENDDLHFEVYDTSDNENILVYIVDSFVYFSSSLNWFGSDWIIFSASDGEFSTNTNNITLSVDSVNDAPKLEHIEDINVLAGNLVEINPSASDVEGDNLEFFFSVPLNENGTWQTDDENFGTYTTTVSVSDGNGGSDSQEVNINVLQKVVINEFVSDSDEGNDWIEIYNPFEQEFDLSSCEIRDGNNNVLYLEGELNGKKFKSFEWDNNLGESGEIIKLYCFNELIDSVSYGNWDDGNILDNAPAPGKENSSGRDPDGKDTGNDAEDLKIIAIPTKNLPNDADMIPPTVNLMNPENNSLFNNTRDITFEFSVNDNLAKILNCGIYVDESLKDEKEVDVEEVGTFFIDSLSDGSYAWNIMCSDGFNTGSSNYWNFDISAPDNPIIGPVDDKTINENEPLEFLIYATDPDGDNLSFSVEALPEGANFIGNSEGSAVFSWTPSYEQAGIYDVRFIVEDSFELKDSETVKITVNDVTQPPKFSDAPQCSNKSNLIEISIKKPDNNDDFEIGKNIEVKVKIDNNFEEDFDFDVEAHLYDIDEEESVADEKETIEIGDGKSETVEFEIKIPDDVEDNEFAIYVYVEDEEERCNSDFVYIDIERQKHDVVVESVEIMPQIVAPGESIDVEVNVENRGTSEEEVYIKIDNTELNISKETEEFELEEYGEDDTETKTLSVEIPEGAEEKTYDLKVTVFFDDGKEEHSMTKSFDVMKKEIKKSSSDEEKPTPNIVSLDYKEPIKTKGPIIVKDGKDKKILKPEDKPKPSGKDNTLFIIDIILAIGIIIEVVLIVNYKR